MADRDLSETDRDRAFWPALFRKQVAANTLYWFDKIGASPAAALLHQERDNVTKAIARAFEWQTAVEPALNLVLSLHPYMGRQGALAEWQRFLEEGLLACRQRGDVTTEAALLDRLGELSRDQGEWSRAAELHAQAYQSSTAIGDQPASTRALINLGYLYLLQGKYVEAGDALREALDAARTCRAKAMEAYACTSLGLFHFEQRQWEEALASHQAAYDLWSEVENLEGMARTRHSMGNAYQAAGDLEAAEAAFRSAMALYEQTDSRLYLAIVAMDMGNLFLARGQSARAESLYRQARDVMERAHYLRGLAQVYNNLGMVCRQQGDRGLAIDFFQRSIGLWRQLGEPVSQANAEDNLAEVYLERHEWELARRVLARARERLSAFKPEGRVQRILSYINEHLRAAEEGEKQDRPSEI